MQGDDVIVFLLLLGLLALVSLIISGLIFITEPLFQGDDITLTNPNLGIAKMALIMSWLSLPITIFLTAKILMKIVKHPVSVAILVLGLLALLAFVLYGLSILSMGLFQQEGVYINSTSKALPKNPKVYSDTLTINCLKLATIFAWLSISWNIFFFIKESSNF
jgi:hypothetical protein